jgi:membrane protein implicated in regulation of membrane protease activity
MWMIWLVIALGAAIGELLTTGLFLASFAVAAVITAVLSLLLLSGTLQVLVFVILSLVGIALFRPVLVSALGWSAHTEMASGPARHTIVNKRAVVTSTVDANGGQIRIGQGEFWSARSFEPSDVIPAGSTVEIVVVDGLTALVLPVQDRVLSSNAAIEKGI